MADEVSIDKATFHNRLSAFISQWKQDKRNGDTLFAGASSIAIVMGKSDESQGFTKTSAMQFWLLGYEFPSTVFVITQDSMHIVTTKKKGIYIQLTLPAIVRFADSSQLPTSSPSRTARPPSKSSLEARMLQRTQSNSNAASKSSRTLAYVSHTSFYAIAANPANRRRSVLFPRTPRTAPSSRSGKTSSRPSPRTWKRSTLHLLSRALLASRTRRNCAPFVMPRAHLVVSWPTTSSTKCLVFWMRRKR